MEELYNIFQPMMQDIISNRRDPGHHARVAQTAHPQNKPVTFPIDVVNEKQQMYIYVEVPGVNKDNIDIDFYNNKLTIIVEKNRVYETPEMSEIKYGRTERTIVLPICVTRKDTVEVTFKNGVLRIKINKLIEEENKFSVKIEDDRKEPPANAESDS